MIKVILVLVAISAAAAAAVNAGLQPQSEEDVIRGIERSRLRALVAADLDTAESLHADEFQLITPRGEVLSKAQYMAGVRSGSIDYLVWEPGEIAVRLHGDSAIIRYQSHLEIIVNGQKVPLARYWHTDSYENRSGEWKVVWSQATAIAQ